jgi:hypothetical protein
MKLSTAWNVLLLVLAGGVLLFVGPKLYHQAAFQFTDPRGSPSMWPATFELFLSLCSLLVALAAFSFVFAGSLGATRRWVAGVLTVALFVGWMMSALMWQHYASAYGGDASLLTEMIRLQVSPVIFISIVALGFAAVSGTGPLTAASKVLRKFRRRS